MEEKRCTKCGLTKPLSEFGIIQSGKPWKRSRCKKCDVQRLILKRKEVKSEIQGKLMDYLKHHPCVDCGESDIIVLEFDHVRGIKKFNIGTEVTSTSSWPYIEKEISKCEVRCANCHRRKTAYQTKNYRWLHEEKSSWLFTSNLDADSYLWFESYIGFIR